MKVTSLMPISLALVLLAGCAAINRTEQKTLVQHNVSPVVSDRMVRGEPLSLNDIIELSRKDVPPQLVTHYLYSIRAVYALDKPALACLNQAKVSKEVIDYLLETPSLFPPQYYYPGPYYAPGPWYPYDACYPYSPYGPRFYGGSSVIIVTGRGHRW